MFKTGGIKNWVRNSVALTSIPLTLHLGHGLRPKNKCQKVRLRASSPPDFLTLIFARLIAIVYSCTTHCYRVLYLLFNAACAAASLAIGTRNGEQDT